MKNFIKNHKLEMAISLGVGCMVAASFIAGYKIGELEFCCDLLTNTVNDQTKLIDDFIKGEAVKTINN